MTETERIYWQKGVPDALRAIFLTAHKRYGAPNLRAALIVLEIANAWAMQGKGAFTKRDLLEFAHSALGYATKREAIRDGFAQLAAIGILVHSGHIYIEREERYEGVQNAPKSSERSSGRPAAHFALVNRATQLARLRTYLSKRLRERTFAPSEKQAVPDQPSAEWFANDPDAEAKAQALGRIDSVRLTAAAKAAAAKALARYQALQDALKAAIEACGGKHLPSTPLPANAYENTRAYIAAYRAALVQAQPGRQVTLRKAAQEIGVAPSTLTAIDQRIGIARLPEYDLVPVTGTGKAMARIAKLLPEAQADPRVQVVAAKSEFEALALDAPHKHLASVKSAKSLDSWAWNQEIEGKTLYLRIQRPSSEVYIGKPIQRNKSVFAALPVAKPKRKRQAARQARRDRLGLWRGFSPRYVRIQLALRGLTPNDDIMAIAAQLPAIAA